MKEPHLFRLQLELSLFFVADSEMPPLCAEHEAGTWSATDLNNENPKRATV